MVRQVEAKQGRFWRRHNLFDFQLSRERPNFYTGMLIAALHFWERSTCTFHFKMGMMTPTLFDIAIIIGLWPIGLTFNPKYDSPEFSSNYENKTFSNFISNHHDIKRDEVSDEEHIAFLTYWLSHFIFYTESLHVVKRLVPMAIQIHEGKDFAFGKLILATLYDSLGKGSDALKKAEKGASKQYLGLVGYQPNLVARQFGFSQFLPKSLFKNDNLIVLGNSEMDEEYFDSYLKDVEKIKYDINPFAYECKSILLNTPKDVAERIMATPLVSSVPEDKVVWKEERNECYSVKSGYKLAMRYIICSDKYHVAGNWNGIWKAQAPHKAHHLLWRLCRGCHPTRYRLLEKRVECTLNCPVCDEDIEDELHIFFKCAVARDSWCAAGLSSVLHNIAYQQSNAMDHIFAMCSNESSDIVGRVAMLLWCIWHNRNDKFCNDNVQMPRQIGRYAFDAMIGWEKPALGWVKCNVNVAFVSSSGRTSSNSVSETTTTYMVGWEKPALGWVKCNVNVAFVSSSGRTSVSLCFRDNNGQFMADMTQWQQTVISSVEGET
ncbi:hypothetical protein TSUD_146060 [Trifolium subterraneum]|uniref:Reverse transcriptase zinc-binding domain-containing protein n=1 Tax=Trifolium subterraneum TaxID=3900 RepID=A0A2Z6MZL3_TRISU|nr:hypothetical protein TSUD_146060 [Trifolium subterraneum]